MTESPKKQTKKTRVDRYFTDDSDESPPQLLGSECPECEWIEFPNKDRCPSCLGSMAPYPLSRIGTLHSFTSIRFGPPQFNPPYTIGCVDLPENVRIFTRLANNTDYEVEQSVQVMIDRVTEDTSTIELGYVFGPVED